MFRKAAIAIAIVVFMFSTATQGAERKSRSRGAPVVRKSRAPQARSRPAVRRRPAHRYVRRHNRRGGHHGSGYYQPVRRHQRYHPRGYYQPVRRQHYHPRRWVSPVYGYREVEVWVPPVYRTVHSDCCRRTHVGDRCRIGRCERRVLVREGYYEVRRVRYVVRRGYWRTLPCSCGRVVSVGF